MFNSMRYRVTSSKPNYNESMTEDEDNGREMQSREVSQAFLHELSCSIETSSWKPASTFREWTRQKKTDLASDFAFLY